MDFKVPTLPSSVQVTLSWKHVLAVIVLVALAVSQYFYGPIPLYANNRFHRHRWASDVCKSRGIAPENCAMIWKTDPRISTEIALYDICLEHGELRRMK